MLMHVNAWDKKEESDIQNERIVKLTVLGGDFQTEIVRSLLKNKIDSS